MTDTHAWGKVITLTGDNQEDCRRVLHYLQENQVVKPMNRVGKPELYPDEKNPLYRRQKYEKTIRNENIEVVIETKIETEEMRVQNAWVKNKKKGLDS